MSEVKWIKITTNMFEDEKIDFIESLPECDAILIIWIKLLAQAGKTNSNGFIFLTEQIPYTDEMLSHKFRRPLNTVKLALQTLKQLEMITFNEEGYLKISNWEKHQNIDGLDKIREQTRRRVAKFREKQAELPISNVTSNVTVTEGNATELELELELELEEEVISTSKMENFYTPIIEYLNSKSGKNYRTSGAKTQDLINARLNEGFTLEDFYKVIDIKVAEWKGNDMDKFLRPETLFSNKFEGYLNQDINAKDKKHDTKFHVTNNRTSDYNAQELEDVAARKRREYREKMKSN